MAKISVVIPTYNEAELIAGTVNEITSAVESLFRDNYEIIIIDDHSCDDTFNIIKGMPNHGVRCIRLSRNSGSHIALRAGLSQAKGDVVLCISADGQDNPGCLKEMIGKWRDGCKVVWALRRNRNNEIWLVRLWAKLFYGILSRFVDTRNLNIDVSRATFFLLDRKAAEAINACPEHSTSLFGLISWFGFHQGAVEYERRPRLCGKSKWNFRKRLRLASDWIIAFSGLPLKMIFLTGLIVASFGFLYAIVIIILAIKGRPPTGWASMMVVILVLGGIQMIMLGIIGEYLWRNIEESRSRPLYFIEKDTSQF